MKRILVFLLLLLLVLTSCGTGKNGPTVDRLLVTDGVLTKESGEPFQLRGLSTHGMSWFPEYITEETFRSVKEAGANVIRAAMYTDAYNSYLSDPVGNLDLMIRAIDCAKAAGLYVIVDWHILEDGDPTLFMPAAIEFFEALTKKYPNDPHILYEICNEPNGVEWETICTYADTVFPVIRERSPDAVIILGTPSHSGDLRQPVLTPYAGENFLYAYHYYAGQHDNYNVLEYAWEQGVPVIVSEWGINYDEQGQPALEDGENFVSWLNAQGISWCAWSLCNKEEVFSVLDPDCLKVSGWEERDLTDVGRVIFSALKGS